MSLAPDFESLSPEDRHGGGPLEAGSPPSDLHLALDFDDCGPHVDILTEPDPVQLERRGVTSHRSNRQKSSAKHQLQGSLFEAGRLHKDSIVSKLISVGAGHIADKLANCHSQKIAIRCDGCGNKVTVFNRCDQFYCPCCTPRLANERREAVEWWVKGIQQPKHVVLTTRNTAELRPEHVTWEKQAFSRLRRSKFATKKTFWWCDKETKAVKPIRKFLPKTDEGETIVSQPWLGGFYALEVTNERRGWHLHVHALVNSKYIDARVLAYMWNLVTRGRGYIVKVKDCRSRSYLQEVTKYAVKGSDLAKWSARDILSFIDAFKGKRTFGVFGSLYGKRTEWADYIAGLKSKRSRCECGCNSFTVQGEREWEFVTAQLVPDSMKSLPPPKVSAQLVFALNTINWVAGAGSR